jgi:hypothetical protein
MPSRSSWSFEHGRHANGFERRCGTANERANRYELRATGRSSCSKITGHLSWASCASLLAWTTGQQQTARRRSIAAGWGYWRAEPRSAVRAPQVRAWAVSELCALDQTVEEGFRRLPAMRLARGLLSGPRLELNTIVISSIRLNFPVHCEPRNYTVGRRRPRRETHKVIKLGFRNDRKRAAQVVTRFVGPLL